MNVHIPAGFSLFHSVLRLCSANLVEFTDPAQKKPQQPNLFYFLYFVILPILITHKFSS